MNITDLKRGQHDADPNGLIKTFQRALEANGYKLVKFGVDGDVGNETIRAAASYALANKVLPEDQIDDIENVIPSAVVAAALSKVAQGGVAPLDRPDDQVAVPAPTANHPLVIMALDMPDKGKYDRNPMNPLACVDTICLHQMACEDGRQSVDSFKRWRNLAVHCVVTAGVNSRAAIFQPLLRRMAHGHGWNNRSVGIEIEGHYAGKLLPNGQPDMRSYWRPAGSNRQPMRLHPETVAAAHQLIDLIVTTISDMGGKIKYISAHRQSYSTKSSDPGQEIWEQIAVPMLAKHGLEQAPTLPNGLPIPEAWDKVRNAGVKY